LIEELGGCRIELCGQAVLSLGHSLAVQRKGDNAPVLWRWPSADFAASKALLFAQFLDMSRAGLGNSSYRAKFRAGVEPPPGFLALQKGRKADDGGRTRDLELGKLALYQLSYVRALGFPIPEPSGMGVRIP
jgi:hypothetical protein